jgi:cyclopropane fatty-acyl-phospholipid synthase-like methyltransferase
MPYTEEDILKTWQLNAKPWIDTLKNGDIPSRALATNKAIVEACLRLKPQRALDIGCGEGWLCRALGEAGVDMTGLDGVSGLIADAQRKGGAKYLTCSYEDLLHGLPDELSPPFDLAVCNFALFGKDLTIALAPVVHGLLTEQGHWVIQTLHPDYPMAAKPGSWATEDWSAMKQPFQSGYAWYRWTKPGWQELLQHAGFKEIKWSEVQVDEDSPPLALLIEARKQA